MKLTQVYRLERSQAEIDFVDIDPMGDLPLFIDPYAFKQKRDPTSVACAEALISFFQAALELLRSGEVEASRRLFQELKEPNETCLGLSKGRPAGRGIGNTQGAVLHDKLLRSRAVISGLLSDLAESELFVQGIGPDKISDLTTNIIRGSLIQYTQQQCDLYEIATEQLPMPPTWSATDREWKRDYHNLPSVNKQPILFVPKGIVRFKMALLSSEYYSDYAVKFLQDEALRSDSALVKLLKNGTRIVTKKSITKTYPFSKDWLLSFTEKHPEVFAAYKALRTSPSPGNYQLDATFNEAAVASALAAEIREIPPGAEHADEYHMAILAALEYILYPDLQEPRKEWQIHSGRKRIDIVFSNRAESGFFQRMLSDLRVGARIVVIECKNYKDDIHNPEIDQLSGRFSPERGRLGLIASRVIEDRQSFLSRCQDTARDNRGYVLPIIDIDILRWLEWAGRGRRSEIDRDLSNRFDEIVSS